LAEFSGKGFPGSITENIVVKAFDSHQQPLQYAGYDPATAPQCYVDERQPKKYWYLTKPSQELQLVRLLDDPQQQDPSKYLRNESKASTNKNCDKNTLGLRATYIEVARLLLR
jgi:hypothetical protein